ncbi:MAG: ABC transporter permease [Culturomica sp.]|nr:ABC transporter permease [Culturomica sp.]
MNSGSLTRKSSAFFARYYRLVALATLITVAVIVGSLVVGDSVRTTLVKRVTERLGGTQTVIFSRYSFMSEELAEAPLFGGAARGILLTNGFISHDGRLIPVLVWGVDDLPVAKGAARMNAALREEIGAGHPEALVLRLPAPGLIPSGSLFVTDSYTTGMRLSLEGVVSGEEGGNISLKNEQVLPFNLFVNRQELAEVLERKGKINLILSDRFIAAGAWEEAWNYGSSGLSVSGREGFTEITSDRVFLQDGVVETICRDNREPNRLFSYLANSIQRGESAIPYSFVTAADRYRGEPLAKEEVILSDYSAKRLQAQTGDRITLTYFTSQDLKALKTDSVLLRVKAIVPLSELLEDKTLSADFPGLSDVERCTDWDSDLPIDMDLITGEDERYWERYRTTPKAIVAYDAVAGDWGNAYGNATAVRVANADPDLSGLTAGMFGIQVIHPRDKGLYAALHGVDFSGLFLALGFFIVVSALLLMQVPLSEMLYRRRCETDLLKALGYTRRRIARMLWLEAAPVVLLSSMAGVVAGLLYTGLVMWLLGNVWRGATHTGGFSVYPSAVTVGSGFLVGVVLSLSLLRRSIVRSLKERKQGTGTRASSLSVCLKRKKACAVVSTLLAAGTVAVNLFWLHSVALFVGVGVLLMGTAALWGDYLIVRKGSPAAGHFHTEKLIWSTLLTHKRQALLSFFTLTTGVFIVFSVGLNRKGFADSPGLRTGTGGYSLWCESSVPIYYDMGTPAGKEKLALTALPGSTEILQCLRYGADDASCLNLNKVTTPTVLGVDMKALASADFQIAQSIYPAGREEVFRQMQATEGKVYPALVDATVLTWSLMMQLGDTLWYGNDGGEPVPIRLAGTLSNSVFQGNILIDRAFFSEIWKETTGSEVFLLKTEEKEAAKMLLSQALHEYGVRVSTTNERLQQFNSVTDTYLTIFLTLGGLGLLLGIMGFVIVVRKNLAARCREITLYRTLGFTDARIRQTLYKENVIVPLYAIAVGVVSSLAGVSMTFSNASAQVWLLALLFALLFVACMVVFVRREVRKEVQNSLY